MLTLRIALIIHLVHVSFAHKVIIIGAGAAGIAAYSTLIRNNITDVLILEAENRIGGRINTVYFGSDLVDLGAEWIHGTKGNAAHELAEKYNLAKESRIHFRLSTSSTPEVDDKLDEQLFGVHDEVFTQDGRIPAEPFETIGSYYTRRYQQLTGDLIGEEREKLKLANYAMEYFESDVISTIGSMSWNDFPANNNYEVTEGDLMQEWDSGGSRMALNILLDRYPNPKKSLPLNKHIRLKKTANKIYWRKNALNPTGVAVSTTDGSIYKADMVLFTASLGVLKNDESKLFVPPLPHSKKEAIHTLAFGTVTKFILHFPNIWWDVKTFTGAGLVWNEDTKNLTRDFPKGPSLDGKSWLLGVRAIHTVRNNPNILSFLVYGPYAPLAEAIPDYIVFEGLDYILNKFFARNLTITKPDKMIRTSWLSRPNFRGTYSYETLSSIVTPYGPKELSQPLLNERNMPSCLFAGEATHPSYYSTVHGAIESGYREAQRIIDYNSYSS